MSSVVEKVQRKEELPVSVVVCCYTEERLSDTLEAVASVRRQVLPPEEVILVVDNNRKLHERMQTELSQVARVVLNEGTCGVSASRNVGIKVARGDLIAFLDDDAVAEPEWLVRLTGPFRDPDVVAAGGRAVLSWAKSRPSWFPEELDWTIGGSLSWLPTEPTVVRNPHGFNMCFRREVFGAVGVFATEVGGIGEIPRSGEEADLCLRIEHRWPTAKVVWEPRAVVVHKVPASKARFSIILWRAYCEGLCKSWIQHSARGDSKDSALSSERAYLTYLLCRALPPRLALLWRLKVLLQAAAIVLSIAAAGLGYAMGEIRNMSPFFRFTRKVRRALRERD